MLHNHLVNPKSIVVVGGSDNIHSPGGRVLKNLIDHEFKGKLLVVNPKQNEVQGVASYQDIKDLPETELAIIAIAAKFVLDTVKILTEEKNTKGFIIFSAGFSEKDEEGKQLESEVVSLINKSGGSLLGPNNIGLINTNYTGVFTTPIPKLDSKGVDFISGSGATAVFIIEAANNLGLTFSSVYTLGNSAQIGVEEMLEYFDVTFDKKNSSKVKLLYVESIKNPIKFLKHSKSLIAKGCKIAAIKAGSSEAGNRAASSHTGAMASPDVFVDALFNKAGIIRCYGRNELITVASILLQKELKGKNIAIITHAGGPAVMLTDVLSKNGMHIPQLKETHKKELLKKLFDGSSASNPIDFLATGTAEQLELIIDYCDTKLDYVDAMVVIFGSPGLTSVKEAYQVLDKKIRSSNKPIYCVLPSVINAKCEIEEFVRSNNIAFSDEVLFGKGLVKVFTSKDYEQDSVIVELSNKNAIRKLIDSSEEGYMSPKRTRELLTLAHINFVEQFEAVRETELSDISKTLDYPVAMKAVGPLHKSDVGGVVLNIKNKNDLLDHFKKLMKIPGTESVIIQPMLSGTEVFIGAKRETHYPHLVMCGLGGVYVEAFKDVGACLIPTTKVEVNQMITNLKSFSILKGIRGQKGINMEAFQNSVLSVSSLLQIAPEISELDINPLLATIEDVIAVDARVKIGKI